MSLLFEPTHINYNIYSYFVRQKELAEMFQASVGSLVVGSGHNKSAVLDRKRTIKATNAECHVKTNE